MEHRMKDCEDEIKELWKAVDGVKKSQSGIALDMELIKKDFEYTKKALDKIDLNIEKLANSNVQDHLTEPLKAERSKKERRQSQVEGVVIGIFVAFILYTLLPFLLQH